MLLYKHGALNKRIREWCEMALDEYEYPVLVSEIFSYEWAKENLKLFHIHRDDDSSCRDSHRYTQIGVPQGYLYFMNCKEDYEKVCSLPTMIDKIPFQTLLNPK